MSGTACSGSLAGISGILQEELLVTISRLHKHLSSQFWAFTVIYTVGRQKKFNFSKLYSKLHLSVLITMNLKEQPRACDSSDTQELLPTT